MRCFRYQSIEEIVMLFSIIIPQYKEDDTVVRKLLTSIDNQLGVDWEDIEVIIVNDGSDVILSEALLSSLLNVKHIHYIRLEKNVGPGLCRQAGLDIAKGEYITFCDADDIYYSCDVLHKYIDEIKKRHPEVIQTQWIEETPIGNPNENGVRQCIYNTHNFDATWMHGKVLNRQFLIDNNIRFSEKLRYNEDSYFLSNAIEIAKDVDKLPIISYVWTHSDDSITRRNNASYTWESIPEFIRALGYSLDFLSNKTPKKIPYKIGQLSLYIYYRLQVNKKWDSRIKANIEKEMALLIKRYEVELCSLDTASFASLDLKERQKVGKSAFIITETFPQWVNRILSEYVLGQNEK